MATRHLGGRKRQKDVSLTPWSGARGDLKGDWLRYKAKRTLTPVGDPVRLRRA
jgi:hypothetical protein